MKRFVVAVISCCALYAYGQVPKVDQPALRDAFADKLKDSESARFKDLQVTRSDGLWKVCGSINSKNSYGAYAGFEPFVAFGVQGKPGTPLRQFPITLTGDLAAAQCQQ